MEISVEPSPKMMMMTLIIIIIMMTIIIIIMGHECIWGTIRGLSEREAGERKGLRGEEDGSMLRIYYEDSIRKPTKHFEKGGGGRGQRKYNREGVTLYSVMGISQ
jgi:hypothetical protein